MAKSLLDFPKFGLGTYKLRGDEARLAVTTALKVGYNHIDTAELYMNQSDIGKALSESKVSREKYWITSKIDKFSINDGVEKMDEIFAKCLKQLGIKYVDLLLLHAPSSDDLNVVGKSVV